MYLLIGKENCSRCEMVKNILDNKNVEYTYKMINDFSEEDKTKYMTLARKEGQMAMPIIIKDETVIDFKEII